MGYYMNVVCCDLKANGLERLPEGVSDYLWTIEDGRVELSEYYFKWYSEFEEELLALSRAGVRGEIELFGEEGEYIKYVLADGVVKLYEGRVVYPDEPSEIIDEDAIKAEKQELEELAKRS
jgi:hypothetical protein